MPSSRKSSVGPEYAGIPLPSALKQNHELLMLIASEQTQAAIDMLKSMTLKEVVGIRGLVLKIDELSNPDDLFDE